VLKGKRRGKKDVSSLEHKVDINKSRICLCQTYAVGEGRTGRGSVRELNGKAATCTTEKIWDSNYDRNKTKQSGEAVGRRPPSGGLEFTSLYFFVIDGRNVWVGARNISIKKNWEGYIDV